MGQVFRLSTFFRHKEIPVSTAMELYRPPFGVGGNTLYGTAQYGGASNGGTIFSVNTDGTGFTKPV